MNEPAVNDFEVTTNFLSDEELTTQLAAEADSHTVGAGIPADDAGDDEAADGGGPPVAVVALKENPREKKARSIQAEIDQNVARRETAKREADAEEARLDSLRAGRREVSTTAGTTASVGSSVATDDPEPTLESCGNDENKFLRDYTRWEIREETRKVLAERDAKHERHTAEETARGHVQAALTTFDKNLDTAIGVRGSEQRTAFLAQTLPIAQQLVPYQPGQPVTGFTAIADSVIASTIPDKLLLHFTANPDDFARIGALSPNQALREVGIIEGSLRVTAASRGPASRPLVASAAPPPTKPLGGSPRVSAEPDDDDDLSESALKRHFTRENTRDFKRRTGR